MSRILTVFSFFAFSFSAVISAQDVADQEQVPRTDEELIELIEDSIRVQTQEIRPLQVEHANQSGELNRKASDAQQLIRLLEEDRPEKLKRIRDEMENISRRLALLEKAEEVLTDMDETAPENAIAELKTTVEESREKARDLHRPFSEQIAAVHRNYNAMNEEFGDAFSAFFKDATGDFEEFTTKKVYGNYAVANVVASWSSKSGKQRVSINLHLHESNLWKPDKPKLFMEKYPIAHESNNNFSFIVADRIKVNAYASGAEKNKFDTRKFVRENLDIEALEKLIEKVEPVVEDQ